MIWWLTRIGVENRWCAKKAKVGFKAKRQEEPGKNERVPFCLKRVNSYFQGSDCGEENESRSGGGRGKGKGPGRQRCEAIEVDEKRDWGERGQRGHGGFKKKKQNEQGSRKLRA